MVETKATGDPEGRHIKPRVNAEAEFEAEFFDLSL